MSMLNYVPRVPSCPTSLTCLVLYLSLCLCPFVPSFFYVISFLRDSRALIFLRAFCAFIFLTCLHFLRALLVFNFLRALHALIFLCDLRAFSFLKVSYF